MNETNKTAIVGIIIVAILLGGAFVLGRFTAPKPPEIPVVEAKVIRQVVPVPVDNVPIIQEMFKVNGTTSWTLRYIKFIDDSIKFNIYFYIERDGKELSFTVDGTDFEELYENFVAMKKWLDSKNVEAIKEK